MDEHTEATLNWFFEAIEPLEVAYNDPWFSFAIYCAADGARLIKSNLVLQPLAIDQPERTVDTGNFYGFSGRLRTLQVTFRELINLVLAGYLPAPDRVWRLSRDGSSMRPSMYRSSMHPTESTSKQQKVVEVFGMGLSAYAQLTDEDQWTLRSSDTPYSDVNDLLRELRLDPGIHQLQVTAWPPVLVEPTSRVSGELAELKLMCSTHLERSKISLGVIVTDRGGVLTRSRVNGANMQWEQSSEAADVAVGTVLLPVPRTSVVHCLATYDGLCLHHDWIGDPEATQNPLRSVYEMFDPGLANTSAMLRQVANKGQSNGLEAAVAGLLWILGFAPLHLGYGRTDAPDVIAISRDGHVLVVECTLTDPQTKKHNKVQKLLDRTTDVRAALQRSNIVDVLCIPVMVISRMRGDIEEEIVSCERKGIVVYTQDDIQPIIASTLSSPRSDVRLREVKERLDEALSNFRRKEQQGSELIRTVHDIKSELNRMKDAPTDW